MGDSRQRPATSNNMAADLGINLAASAVYEAAKAEVTPPYKKLKAKALEKGLKSLEGTADDEEAGELHSAFQNAVLRAELKRLAKLEDELVERQLLISSSRGSWSPSLRKRRKGKILYKCSSRRHPLRPGWLASWHTKLPRKRGKS